MSAKAMQVLRRILCTICMSACLICAAAYSAEAVEAGTYDASTRLSSVSSGDDTGSSYVLNDSDGDGVVGTTQDELALGTMEINDGIYVIRNVHYNKTMHIKGGTAQTGEAIASGKYLAVSSTQTPDNTDTAFYIKKEDGYYRLYALSLDGSLSQSFTPSSSSAKVSLALDRVVDFYTQELRFDGSDEEQIGCFPYMTSADDASRASLFDFHPMSILDSGSQGGSLRGVNSGFVIKTPLSVYAKELGTSDWSWQQAGIVDMYVQEADGWVVNYPLWVLSSSNQTPNYVNSVGGRVFRYFSSSNVVANLRAQIWQLSYPVAYHLNGGNAWDDLEIYGQGDDEYVLEYWDLDGTSHTLPTPSREGYVLEGWATDDDPDTVVYKAGEKYTSLESVDKAKVYKNLYAVWRPARYTIRYDANTGAGSMADQVVDVGKSATLDKCAFSKSGSEFIGWNTKADGSGDVYSDCQQIDGLAFEDGDVVTVYAQWKEMVYTVSIPTLISYSGMHVGQANTSDVFDVCVEGSFAGVLSVSAQSAILSKGNEQLQANVASGENALIFNEPGTLQDKVSIKGLAKYPGQYIGCISYSAVLT